MGTDQEFHKSSCSPVHKYENGFRFIRRSVFGHFSTILFIHDQLPNQIKCHLINNKLGGIP